jgi:predicted N-acetyltransferase YhbS
MLGPIAIEPALHGLGLGAKLMRDALGLARSFGHRAVLLVGDARYYERFGFTSQAVSGLRLPGPHERERFLGLEFVPGALAGAKGMVSVAGLRVTTRVRTVRPVLAQAA